jgi:hypothetical protein
MRPTPYFASPGRATQVDRVARSWKDTPFTPQAVLATCAALEARFDVPTVFLPTPDAAALQIESWACWCARELLNSARRIDCAAGEQGHAESPPKGGGGRGGE